MIRIKEEDVIKTKNVEIERQISILDFYIKCNHVKYISFTLSINPYMGKISLKDINVRDKGFAFWIAEFLKLILEKFYGMCIEDKMVDMIKINIIQHFRQLYRTPNIICIVDEKYDDINLKFTINFN